MDSIFMATFKAVIDEDGDIITDYSDVIFDKDEH